MVDCVPPKIAHKDHCKFDVSGCQNVSEGSTCNINCAWPYAGASAMASCPDSNSDPFQKLFYYEPQCTFTCPDIEAIHVPAGGYTRKDVNSSWECAHGHVGSPYFTCIVTGECTPHKELVGCLKLQPCLVRPVDSCRVDVSKCQGLPWSYTSTSCDVKCKAPYWSEQNAITGSCPALNTDPRRYLEWSAEPICNCAWPSLSNIPKGHYRKGNLWHCNDSYAPSTGNGIGNVSATCIQHADCSTTWSISGCTKTLPCLAPQKMLAAMPDQCPMVAPGETCLARCLPTTCVAGGPLEFKCPWYNINPEMIMDTIGQCRVRCEVCTLGLLWDVDSRRGFLSGNLPFGGAHAEGGVLTGGIEGFKVYFADSCFEKIGEAIAYVPSNTSTPRACCLDDQYIATLRGVEIPKEAVRLLVAVVSVTAGELPLGMTTNFTDRSWNFTKKSIKQTVRQSSARRMHGDSSIRWSLLALAILLSSARGNL